MEKQNHEIRFQHYGFICVVDCYDAILEVNKEKSFESWEKSETGWYFQVILGKEILHDTLRYGFTGYSRQRAIEEAKKWINDNFRNLK